jgi:alpha/beta superfamily hydrolase
VNCHDLASSHDFMVEDIRAFNRNYYYRGVGRSEGKFDNGEGELKDAASAFDWLQAYNPNASACWIAGFSFGAWIGMQLLMRRPDLSGFISVRTCLHNWSKS